jgi:hypothetical protein
MDYLIKIFLTIGEWIEDWRGRRQAQRETERKTILTFLSQGAVGGMLGYFLIIVFGAFSVGGYAPFYFPLLPFLLVFGAVLGAVAGLFIWLPGALLKRRMGFIGRTFSVIGGMSLLSAAVFYGATAEKPSDEMYVWVTGYLCALYLPIILITGSAIRPGRALLFGVGGGIGRRRFRHWLAVPPGLLLRAASVLGLLEALLALIVWIFAQLSPWSNGSAGSDVSAGDGLPELVVAFAYFATSAYLSFKTPRKTFLPLLAFALNLPAVFLMITEKAVGTSDSDFLAYSYFGFICLWIVYTVGCLIAPENVSHAARLVNGTFTLKQSDNTTVLVRL